MHLCHGILLSHKRERHLAICNMDESRGCYAKHRKSERERQIPYQIYKCLLTYLWSFKQSKQTNKTNGNSPLATENHLMAARGEGGVDGWER